jgi:excisionase family DNA binding protein
MSAPNLADALRTLARELPPALELFASELEARATAPAAPPAIEIVSIATFAREHSLHEATVRQMAKEGRIEATKIGKRQWRVRRDSPIGQPMARGATSMDSPSERARRLVEKLK